MNENSQGEQVPVSPAGVIQPGQQVATRSEKAPVVMFAAFVDVAQPIKADEPGTQPPTAN